MAKDSAPFNSLLFVWDHRVQERARGILGMLLCGDISPMSVSGEKARCTP